MRRRSTISEAGVTFVVLDLGGLTVEWLGVEQSISTPERCSVPYPGCFRISRSAGHRLSSRHPAHSHWGKNIIVDTILGNRLTPKQVRNFVVE